MEYQLIVFYFSLVLSAGCVAEIYVRIRGLGERVERVRGELIPNKPKIAAPFVLLVAALALTVITLPH